MRFEVETGGRRRTIDVQPSGADWIVVVDGQAISANLAQVGSQWSLVVRRIDPDRGVTAPALGRPGRSHEVAIESRGRGEHAVYVDGHEIPVSILDPRNRRVRGRGGSTDATGPSVVVSPMPGRVVKVLVAPGDVVTARQSLVVVEAMKMENELRAPRAGTVIEVRVREGAPVEANTVLVVVEPDPE